MLRNNTYKKNLTSSAKHLLSKEINDVIKYIESDITYGLLVGGFGTSHYGVQDINSFIFDEIAKQYSTNNKNEFKKGINFIRENAFIYTPEDYDKTKFSNLVHDDCYQELTEIIGMTPDEYLNSLSA